MTSARTGNLMPAAAITVATALTATALASSSEGTGQLNPVTYMKYAVWSIRLVSESPNHSIVMFDGQSAREISDRVSNHRNPRIAPVARPNGSEPVGQEPGENSGSASATVIVIWESFEGVGRHLLASAGDGMVQITSVPGECSVVGVTEEALIWSETLPEGTVLYRTDLSDLAETVFSLPGPGRWTLPPLASREIGFVEEVGGGAGQHHGAGSSPYFEEFVRLFECLGSTADPDSACGLVDLDENGIVELRDAELLANTLVYGME